MLFNDNSHHMCAWKTTHNRIITAYWEYLRYRQKFDCTTFEMVHLTSHVRLHLIGTRSALNTWQIMKFCQTDQCVQLLLNMWGTGSVQNIAASFALKMNDVVSHGYLEPLMRPNRTNILFDSSGHCTLCSMRRCSDVL